MTNVLIRDVPDEDLELIRAAADERGVSVQKYLRESVHNQAGHVRRRRALARADERLRGRPGVPDEAREAVGDAVDAAHEERARRLSDRSDR